MDDFEYGSYFKSAGKQFNFQGAVQNVNSDHLDKRSGFCCMYFHLHVLNKCCTPLWLCHFFTPLMLKAQINFF